MVRDVILSALLRVRHLLSAALLGPQLPVFVLALGLAGIWLGGRSALAMLVIGVPVTLGLAGLAGAGARSGVRRRPGHRALRHALDRGLKAAPGSGGGVACLLIGIDHDAAIARRYGAAAARAVRVACLARLRAALRRNDPVIALDAGHFGVAVMPAPGFDIGAAHALAARLGTALEAPLVVEATPIYFHAPIGLCHSDQIERPCGRSLMAAAVRAQEAALSATDAAGAPVRLPPGPDSAAESGGLHVIPAPEKDCDMGEIRPGSARSAPRPAASQGHES